MSADLSFALKRFAAPIAVLLLGSRGLAGQGSNAAVSQAGRVVPVTAGVDAPARSVGWGVTTINVDSALMAAHPRTLSELLAARVPGLSVVRLSGDPDAGSYVRLRGATSVWGEPQPLLVVDGVPVEAPDAWSALPSQVPSSRLDDFDPEDIERIDILSGPASSAIYGVGAGRGAILLTTRGGAGGSLNVRGWSEVGVSSNVTSLPANYTRSGTSPRCTLLREGQGQCVPGPLETFRPLERAGLFTSGRSEAAGFSASGGLARVRTYWSGRAQHEAGVLDADYATRYHTRLNVSREFFGRLHVSGGGGYVRRAAVLRQDDPVSRGLRGWDDVNRDFFSNPSFAILPTPQMDRDGSRLTRGANASMRILPWLDMSAVVGRDEVTQREHSERSYSLGGSPRGDSVRGNNWRASSIAQISGQARYVGPGRVGMSTIVSFQDTHLRLVEKVDSITFFAVPGDTLVGSSSATRWDDYGSRGWMLQQRADVGGRFFANVGTRWTGPRLYNKRGHWHPAADVAWLSSGSPNPALRIRAAYAESDAPRDTTTPVFVVFNPFVPQPPIPEPEQPRELEVGADWSVGRFVVNGTLFNEWTRSLHLVGFFGFPLKAGKVENRGVELSVHAPLLDRQRVRWTVAGTLSAIDNRLRAFPDPAGDVLVGQPVGVVVGQPYTYTDLNGDGLPSQNEFTFLNTTKAMGSQVPSRQASVRSEIHIHRLGLTIGGTIDYRGGHRAIDRAEYLQCGARTCRAQNDPDSPPADIAEAAAAALMGASSAAFVRPASYTRWTELAVGWNPPVRGRLIWPTAVSVEARNLATWTRFPGLDPEIATAGRGLGLTPALPRVFSMRVDVGAGHR